jgi:nuclear pore complex protein Nup98-Nup96
MRVRDFSDRGDPGVHASRDDDDRTDADDGVEGHSPSADLLASGYALQLENLGLLQEAVFVLLHIEGSAGCVALLLLYDSNLTQ